MPEERYVEAGSPSTRSGLFESVLRAKADALLKNGVEKVIPDFPFFPQSRRRNRQKRERWLGPDVASGPAKLGGRLKLPLGAFADQAQINIAVGARFATGVRLEKTDRLQRHHPIERLQALAERVGLVAQTRRQIVQHEFH